MSVRTVSIPWTTLFSAVNTNNGLFVPVTGWMDAASVRLLRFTFEVIGTTDATGTIQGGLQTTNADGSGDTPITVGSPKQGDGMSYPTAMTDVGSTTAGKQLVRLGFWFKTSEAVLKLARVGGKADIES